ncbi:ECF RNA polymerase sigma factor SigK [Cellulomonas fulva]|uniref:ECF RNA polymerase sigma factor SigK n=1 Tax=Cellulomonas fulva TaxID=2835530 RepID=UPI0027DD0E4C|nr:ECF RNA polymerase sigma factor SigK [Cellulomonas fulva]
MPTDDPPVRAPDRAADALVQDVARGDQGAFARLYDLLGSAVFGVCLRVLRDPDHAAEVAQEVWLEVWRGAARFDEQLGTARTWTLTTAHRRAVDRVRSVQAQRDRDQHDLDLQPARPFDEVAESVETSLERVRVQHCLETLTDTQRRAVELAYYGGRTYREVADELGAALPTVKSRIRDGLLRLRTCLGVSA